MSTLTLISEVEMTWILMPFSERVRNMVWATPGWARMPMPMMETFAMFESEVISTSEIKVSVLIAEEYVELAVRALHSAYELDAA